MTTEEFVRESNLIHNNKYDYSLTKYEKSRVEVKIICPIHGPFEQKPYSHLQGRGCKKCSIEYIAKKQTFSREKIIEKANLVHNGKYDYSRIEYENLNSIVEIICPIHGPFSQQLKIHLLGCKCKKCALEEKRKKLLFTTEKFKELGNSIHNGFYDYSLVDYVNYKTEVEIICPIHGPFLQKPREHLYSKSKCPRCSSSKGEEKVREYLVKNNFKFIEQHKFKDCRNKKQLPFDFFLPLYNICIEFDGGQHFKPVSYFGGQKSLEYIKQNDLIKTKYCEEKGIGLIRINYLEFNKVETILKEKIYKMIEKKDWVVFCSQTGSEIVRLSKVLNKVPTQVVTNNFKKLSLETRRWFSQEGITVSCIPFNPVVKDYIDLELTDNSLITLHGYLRIIPPSICEKYQIYNGHPGLITLYPELKGKDPQARAFENRYSLIGSVVHKVTAGVDEGEVLESDSVEIELGNTILNDYYTILQETSLNAWKKFFSK